MFFRKRKKYLTEKSTQAASDTDRFADVIFGLCFEGIKPNDNMRITAAATNVATIWRRVDLRGALVRNRFNLYASSNS